ncbi:cytochrome P450 [Streptomyces iconiensis]|uniref:Cytochrome P450 n=1 Tax=Streptomyces iconiensis TaxID=1384038 RepID=A0ABT6ZZH4_9ACTN|nr:cytochrome P450 [Streptomyces iconiensis]MDJ1134470.1 cytochrome P450 [Streptomyces iconiensis]
MDIFADHSSADATPLLARTVAERPLLRSRSGLYVYSAAHADSVLTGPSLLSTRKARALDSAGPYERHLYRSTREFFAKWPVFSDGDHHDRVRQAVVRGLGQLRTARLRATWEASATRRLASLRGTSFDWMEGVARPLAREAVAAVVGDSADELIQLGSLLIHDLATPALDRDRAESALAAVAGLRDWLDDGIRRGHAAGSPFLGELAALWHTEGYGPDAATAALAQVVTGAYDPVVSTLGTVGEYLDAASLRALPLAALREEVLRCATPFRFTSRYPERAVTIGPHRLEAGERVVVGLATANLDPHLFPQPLRWRERGGPGRSYTFGAGRHYCPGAGLARQLTESLLAGMAAQGAVFRPDSVQRAPELPIRRYVAMHGHLA